MNSHCQYCSGSDQVLTPHNVFTGKIYVDYSNKQLPKINTYEKHFQKHIIGPLLNIVICQ